LIVVDSSHHLKIPVIWRKILDMDRETFIETQALTPGENPTSSIRGREGKKEE